MTVNWRDVLIGGALAVSVSAVVVSAILINSGADDPCDTQPSTQQTTEPTAPGTADPKP